MLWFATLLVKHLFACDQQKMFKQRTEKRRVANLATWPNGQTLLAVTQMFVKQMFDQQCLIVWPGPNFVIVHTNIYASESELLSLRHNFESVPESLLGNLLLRTLNGIVGLLGLPRDPARDFCTRFWNCSAVGILGFIILPLGGKYTDFDLDADLALLAPEFVGLLSDCEFLVFSCDAWKLLFVTPERMRLTTLFRRLLSMWTLCGVLLGRKYFSMFFWSFETKKNKIKSTCN